MPGLHPSHSIGFDRNGNEVSRCAGCGCAMDDLRAGYRCRAVRDRRGGETFAGVRRRRLVLDVVAARPGISFNALAKATGIAKGSLAHHTSRLTREGAMWQQKEGNRRFHFAGAAPTEGERRLAVAAALLTPRLCELACHIRLNGPVPQAAIGAAFPMRAKSSLQADLARLERIGLVRSTLRLRSRVYRAIAEHPVGVGA